MMSSFPTDVLLLDWALIPVLVAASLTQTYATKQGRFNCRTTSCSLQENWVPVGFANSTQVCTDAQGAALSSFGVEAPQMCRFLRDGGIGWKDCRNKYCEMYETLVEAISHNGGTSFYGGEECRPLLAFNKTLCQKHYRDADAFCNCFCPSLHLFNPPPSCEAQLMGFLLFGRRGVQLAERYTVSGYCATFLCEYLSKVGEPNPVVPVADVPAACHEIHLPWRYGQCLQLIVRRPYNPCPWDQATSADDVLKCSDQSEHFVDNKQYDTWSVCNDHNYRWQCPQNYPIMCDGRHCIGSSDHCCKQLVTECRTGLARQCSYALSLGLPEWQGLLTPELIASRVTTTTVDPVDVYLAQQASTSYEPSIADKVQPFLPLIVAAISCLGLGISFGICVYFGRGHVAAVVGFRLGTTRFLNVYSADPVSVFKATGEMRKHKSDEVTFPDPRKWQEAEAKRRDAAACEALEAAVTRARARGPNNLATSPVDAVPEEDVAKMRQAIAGVRDRGLQDSPGNKELIAFASQWLKTLEAERVLAAALEEARPMLHVIGRRTGIGHEEDAALRASAWHQVDTLREALRTAESENTYKVQLQHGKQLLSELVARAPELPVDRCILDPEGDGLRLLPKGSRRAVWMATGDSYLHRPGDGTAGEIGEPPPAPEMLGDVSVDEARPVCAEFAKKRSCHAGKRCPWRHCTPKSGDTIRECILFEDL